MSCHHENCQEHETKEKERVKLEMILYIVSILIFALSFIPSLSNIKWLFYIVVIILSGYDLIWQGIKNIFHLNFEEDTLMTIAIIAAFVIGEFPESCMIILLFKLGEFIEEKAVETSNSNIQDIVNIKAKTANILQEDDQSIIVDADTLLVGDRILIKPGEMVPVDCVVLSGQSHLDTANITGESKPVSITSGNEILSGSINLNGALICSVQKDSKNSTASQIVDLVYQAKNNKGKTEEFITKFSKVYTPIVIVIAVLLFVIPFCIGLDRKEWIMKALVFLVASCPCSIVISIPLAFFSCIGAISKKGMIIKGTKHIEKLSKAKAIAFDKTGTLTTGKMTVKEIVTLGNYDQETLLFYMASLERNSNHPISTAILAKAGSKYGIVEQYKEIAGHGICGTVQTNHVLFGNKKLLESYQITYDQNVPEDAIYLAIDGKLEGYLVLEEEVRKSAITIVKQMKAIGIHQVIMLTGDNGKSAKEVAKELEITQVYSELLPNEKLDRVNELKINQSVIFVGDGINDSPVLATSDFGISMGEGTEIANNIADGILLSNRIDGIPEIIQIARKSMKIIQVNIVFSLIIKAIVLILGFFGIAPVWMAILADTGVTLLTVLNSLRIFRFLH